jgi:hypothetical protein
VRDNEGLALFPFGNGGQEIDPGNVAERYLDKFGEKIHPYIWKESKLTSGFDIFYLEGQGCHP